MFDLNSHKTAGGFIKYHTAIKQEPKKVVIPGHGNIRVYTEMVDAVEKKHHIWYTDVNYYMKKLFDYFEINFVTKYK
jgi:hypothetical protein